MLYLIFLDNSSHKGHIAVVNIIPFFSRYSTHVERTFGIMFSSNSTLNDRETGREGERKRGRERERRKREGERGGGVREREYTALVQIRYTCSCS